MSNPPAAGGRLYRWLQDSTGEWFSGWDLSLSLPYPPSVNHYYRNIVVAGRPRTLISRQGRAYREEVRAVCSGVFRRPIEGRVAVAIILHPPDRRRRDLDNALKALLDSLQHGGAFLDDSQIVRLSIRKDEAVEGGRADITIGAAPPPPE